MTASMTGFAAHTLSLGPHSFAIEIKSVNQRALEISFRLPEELRALEIPIRDLISKRVARGKLECRIGLTLQPVTSPLSGLNNDILESLSHWQAAVRQRFPEAALLSVNEILHWPGIVQGAVVPTDTLVPSVLAGVELALNDFMQTRLREGDKLKQHILLRLTNAEQRLEALRSDWPRLADTLRQQLKQRLQEALGEALPDRLAQEMALYVQKMDVDEEQVRLSAHLSEVRRVLEQGGVAGKRLDFLMQELHREANTLGAKSMTLELSQVSLDLKVLIEQMREQVQNIE